MTGAVRQALMNRATMAANSAVMIAICPMNSILYSPSTRSFSRFSAPDIRSPSRFMLSSSRFMSFVQPVYVVVQPVYIVFGSVLRFGGHHVTALLSWSQCITGVRVSPVHIGSRQDDCKVAVSTCHTERGEESQLRRRDFSLSSGRQNETLQSSCVV